MTAPDPEQMRALGDGLSGIELALPEQTAQRVVAAQQALRAAADQLEAAQAVVRDNAGWYDDAPEDSWRFERDVRAALGMEQYTGNEDD